jgi:outer membrane protein TolC
MLPAADMAADTDAEKHPAPSRCLWAAADRRKNDAIAFFPSITLTAHGGFESTALSSLFSPASALYSLAGGITQPIFEGGLLESALEQHKARYDELVAD